MLCRISVGENASIMADESAKRAAQEFLAAKLCEEGQQYENKVNLEAAIALGPKVWKKVAVGRAWLSAMP
jgi:hypothetical protein